MTQKRAAKPPRTAAKPPKKPAIAEKKPKKAVKRPAAGSARKSAAAKKLESACGPLERLVRDDVAKLEKLSATHESLAELAFTLARELDNGAGLGTSAVSKELRATLSQLTKGNDDIDEDLKRFVAGLSAEVGDTAKPRSANTRRKGR